MDLPWTTRAQMEPGSDYLVIASHLPLKRITSTIRFVRGVSAIRKQLATADGLVGYTLRAEPLARDYWTQSVWQDEAALRQFMRTPPHAGLMTSLRPLMAPTKFATWAITAADGRPSMAGALDRLDADDPPGITLQRYESAEREMTMREARTGMRVHALIVVLVLAAAILVNVFAAPGYPWSAWVAAGNAIGLFFHWLGYRHTDRDLRRRQHLIGQRAAATAPSHP